MQSLVENGIDPATVPISEGEMFNSFMKDWVEMDLDAFWHRAASLPGRGAVDVALKVLNGEEVEPMTYVICPPAPARKKPRRNGISPIRKAALSATGRITTTLGILPLKTWLPTDRVPQ